MSNSSPAFLCPGQASQSVGMGADLYESSSIARELYDLADNALGWSVSKTSFEGPAEELNRTEHTQPALFVHSVVCGALLKEHGVQPTVAAGHSLGEYSALALAGVFTFEEGLTAVAERGRLMAQAGASSPGAMAAVLGVDDDQVTGVCRDITGEGHIVVAANFNSPGQVVISGSIDGVKAAAVALADIGAKRVVPLPVSGAFHSPLMQPVQELFAAFLAEIPMADAQIPVISNVTAEPVQDSGEIRSLLIAQLTLPISWTASMARLGGMAPTSVLEVGPKNVLQGLMKRINRDIKVQLAGTVAAIKSVSTQGGRP
ncbi:MAG: ACP S-malonyltransferase [Candidatus Latescibacteria bacterium]|nr:ACP S-malonyltransferase [Candidatus Latescibacterota bacterium]